MPRDTAAATRARQEKAAESGAYARTWRAERRPVAATDPYPFHGHRRCSEWEGAEQ